MSDEVNMTIEDIEEMMTRLGGPAEDLIGTIAEVGIRTNRTLSRIDDTLERIAVALETANNMRGDD